MGIARYEMIYCREDPGNLEGTIQASRAADGEYCKYGDVEKLLEELAAAKALLKRIFVDGCNGCSLQNYDNGGSCLMVHGKDYIDGLAVGINEEGRRPDCPYLPFEEKK